MSEKKERLKVRYFLSPFIAVLVILSLIAFFYFKNDEVTNKLIHAQRVKISIRKLRAELKDAEIGQMSYIITQDSSFLEPYFTSEKTFRLVANQTRSLLEGDELQLQRLDSIEVLSISKFDIIKSSIDLINQDEFWKAINVVKERSGKEKMDLVRGIMDRMYKTENDALNRRNDRLSNWRNAIIVLILFSLIFIALNLYNLYKRIKPIFDELVVTQNTLQNVNDNLSESLYNFKKSNQENEYLLSQMTEKNERIDSFVNVISDNLKKDLNLLNHDLDLLEEDLAVQKNSNPILLKSLHRLVSKMNSSINSLSVESTSEKKKDE